MAQCREQIGGKTYTWNVPSGYSKEKSRVFIFWTVLGSKIPKSDLDGTWIQARERALSYKTA